MTNDGWGSKWPSKDTQHTGKAIAERQAKDKSTLTCPTTEKAIEDWIAEAGHDHTPWPSEAPELTGLDLGTGERTILTTFENDSIKHRVIDQSELKVITWPKEATQGSSLKSQGSNLVDDQQYLYFQCEGCKDILDPHTKSFAKLQEHRVNAGWKCIWNIDGMGYKIYCTKCGEKVEL